MQIYEVTDQRFRKYGRVLDTPSLTGEVRKELAEQMEKTPLPAICSMRWNITDPRK